MKKLLLSLLFFSTSLLLNAQSDPSIKWLHPQPQGNWLRWVKMFNENTWYVGGEYGSLFKTTDGGISWTGHTKAGWKHNSYPGTYTVWHTYTAWFFDENSAVLVGNNMGGILRTTDGGQTIDTVRILASGTATLNNVYFLNGQVGYICGASTYGVHRTTDGGNTWSKLSALPSGTYYDVYAKDTNNIITSSSSGKLYRSTDAGASWILIQLTGTSTLNDLHFINPDTGFVVGTSGLFGITTDGGATWTSSQNSIMATLRAMKVTGNEILTVGSNDDSLFKSTDWGATWTASPIVASGDYSLWGNYGLDKFGSTVVVVGGYGTILKSTDNGTTWVSVSSKVSDATFPYSLYVNRNTGKILAQGYTAGMGSIFYSNDFGGKWFASPFVGSTADRPNRTQMFNDSIGYVVGNNAKFWKTSDGGLTLTTVPVGVAGVNNLIALEFYDYNNGVIAGGLPGVGPAQQTFFGKTTDGGLTWTDNTPQPNNNNIITCLDMADRSTGYAGGGPGFVFKTKDEGNTWTRLAPQLNGSVNSVKAFDSLNVYAVTSNGKFYKSTDGAATWTEAPISVTISSAFGQEWLDMNNGIIFGTLGVIAKTSDAGQTWRIMNAGGWTAYGAYMPHPDTFWISAGYGQVSRYAAGIIPVELSSLIGYAEGNDVLLNWTTATEKNNRGFQVERALTGGRSLEATAGSDWAIIGFVEGRGTTTENSVYSFRDKNLTEGSYIYRIKQTDFDGTYRYYYLGTEIEIGTPDGYALNQNYPNPFNPVTRIDFSVPTAGNVTIKLYDINGAEVKTIVNAKYNAGRHHSYINAEGLSSGVYFYQMTAGSFTSVKKLSVLK